MKRLVVAAFLAPLILLSCQSSEKQHSEPQAWAVADTSSCDPTARGPAALYCVDLFRASSTDPIGMSVDDIKARVVAVNSKELSALEISQLWEPLSRKRDFTRIHDDAFWASLIGSERLQEAKMNEQPAVLVFGEETSFNWLSALRRLDRIRIGEFHLTESLASEVNRDIFSAWETHLKFLSEKQETTMFAFPSRLHAALNKALPIFGGNFRRNALYHVHSMYKPINEAEFKNLRENRAVSGIDFWEMPWSRKGKRFVIFRYPPKEVAEKKVVELFEETNRRMDAIRSGSSSEDPIDLAAEFQWRFVQIHPLINGNGRTGRALMTRILAEFGLPPSSRRMIDVDYTLSLQEQTDLVREGVVESIRLLSHQPLPERVTVYRRGFGNRLSATEIKQMTDGLIKQGQLTNKGRQLLPTSGEQIFTIGGKKFTLGDDLMFTDRFGVPHSIRWDHGRYEMYPLTDKTYMLYGFGGQVNGIKHVMRDLSPSASSVLGQNLRFLSEMASSPAIARDVKVFKYENIERANNRGEFQFYSWQAPLLLAVTKINEDPIRDPLAVLVQNRGHRTDRSYLGRSYVEKAFFKGDKELDVSEIIGHYIRMDQFYWEIQAHVKSSKEEFLQNREFQEKLLGQVAESRAKLHTAARQLLRPYIEQLSKLDRADRAYLMEHPQFRQVYEYFLRTSLAYSTLEEAARRLNPDALPVMRSAASSRVNVTGFMSDRQIKDLVTGIPFIGPRFEGFIRDVKREIDRVRGTGAPPLNADSPYFAKKIAEMFSDNLSVRNGVRALLDYIFVHPNAQRSLDPEMGRAFVTQYLHTQLDLGPKDTLSTTTNPAYLLKEKKDGSFEAKFAWQDATIYIIEVARAAAHVDIASGYAVQMELGMEPLSRRQSRRAIQIAFRAEAGNVYPLPNAPITERSQQMMRLLFGVPVGRTEGDSQGRLERESKLPTRAFDKNFFRREARYRLNFVNAA